ncbi:hypothetical protein KR51_00020910 [Rubidibacter lacunae KORDI 51-2]|uniref:Uncharacterized protein n=1 Tax=Rubidibacter lacunae KORDI 51-2 TaxID=582515 RepID=U5DIL6_9CHRO|nr:hypothetical protein KR51_00020910 [Rubidibacter lacunae KORDI 51-2]
MLWNGRSLCSFASFPLNNKRAAATAIKCFIIPNISDWVSFALPLQANTDKLNVLFLHSEYKCEAQFPHARFGAKYLNMTEKFSQIESALGFG